jgi:uncharacterized protein
VAAIIDVKVIPNSGKQKFFIDKSGILKCYLKSLPEKGKANEEVIKLIAKKLRLPCECIRLINGLKSPKKRIKIETDLDKEKIKTILAGDS